MRTAATAAPEAYESQCAAKRRYPSPSSAERHRAGLQRARRNRNLRLRVYRCPFCKYWHLTHKNYEA